MTAYIWNSFHGIKIYIIFSVVNQTKNWQNKACQSLRMGVSGVTLRLNVS